MNAVKTVFIVIDIIICLALMTVVIVQSGKTSGLSGALSGGSDTFLSRNKSRTFDARLARSTKWLAGVFVIVTIILNMI